MVQHHRPAMILEFGSGSSTVALAWAVSQVGPADFGPRVISVEQDAEQADRTRDLLRRANLEQEALVMVAPLTDQVIEGQPTTCYALGNDLGAALHGRLVDLVIIDGPAGPPGVRFGTLPLARAYLRRGAPFALDDALRDGELDVAGRWSALPYCRIQGIRLIEKGLLVGSARP